MTGFECIFDGLVRMTLNSFLFRRGKWREKYPSNGWRNQPTSLYYCSHLGSHLTEKLFIIAAYLIICANIGGVWYLPNFISQIWWCIILRPLKPLCKTLSVLLAFGNWHEPFMVPYYFYLLYNVSVHNMPAIVVRKRPNSGLNCQAMLACRSFNLTLMLVGGCYFYTELFF